MLEKTKMKIQQISVEKEERHISDFGIFLAENMLYKKRMGKNDY